MNGVVVVASGLMARGVPLAPVRAIARVVSAELIVMLLKVMDEGETDRTVVGSLNVLTLGGLRCAALPTLAATFLKVMFVPSVGSVVLTLGFVFLKSGLFLSEPVLLFEVDWKFVSARPRVVADLSYRAKDVESDVNRRPRLEVDVD